MKKRPLFFLQTYDGRIILQEFVKKGDAVVVLGTLRPWQEPSNLQKHHYHHARAPPRRHHSSGTFPCTLLFLSPLC